MDEKNKIEYCRAKCRDGTDCLNHVCDENYCWLHLRKKN